MKTFLNLLCEDSLVTFYKAVRKDTLGHNFIPGTVTTDFEEALMWYNRYNSKKKTGVTRHIKQGEAVIIKFKFDSSKLKGPEEFQRADVHEHSRDNCWTSSMKQKAQINSAISNYEIVDISDYI